MNDDKNIAGPEAQIVIAAQAIYAYLEGKGIPQLDLVDIYSKVLLELVSYGNGFPSEVSSYERGLILEEAAIDTDEPDVPPAGWHICACSEDCGAWEPDVECDYAGCKNPAQGDGRPFCAEHHNTDEGVDPERESTDDE